jgi:hypothetical protein
MRRRGSKYVAAARSLLWGFEELRNDRELGKR